MFIISLLYYLWKTDVYISQNLVSIHIHISTLCRVWISPDLSTGLFPVFPQGYPQVYIVIKDAWEVIPIIIIGVKRIQMRMNVNLILWNKHQYIIVQGLAPLFPQWYVV